MSETGREQQDARLEPTIAPVRRPVAEAKAKSRIGLRWFRPLLLGLAAVTTLTGIIVVFAFLPNWVEETGVEPEPVVEVDIPVEPVPVLSPEERAALTAEAQALSFELIEQQRALSLRSVESWGDTTWTAYGEAATEADQALLDDDPQLAVEQYRTALDIGATLIARSDQIISEALAAGEQAISLGDAELATSQFELVLAVDPDNARARAGLERASALPSALAAMNRGDEAAERGELEAAAAAYREVLAVDPAFAAARVALDAINQRIEDARFDRLLNEGFVVSEDGRYERAAEIFTEALAMRPDSPAALDGLERAEQGIQSNAILLAEVRARAFESREVWDQAIARYEEALATDPTLAFAIEGLRRARMRADLDAKLEALNGEPARMLEDGVLDEGRAVLVEAEEIEDPGPRLLDQMALLGRLIELATTPIQVTLISDEETEVSVYRVGDLGRFATMEISLTPGRYTAVGQRRGYRDVRQTFNVLPGNMPEPVTVVCAERI